MCNSFLHPKRRFVTTLLCEIVSSTLKDEFPPPLSHPKDHNPLPFLEVVLKQVFGYNFPAWLEVVVDWRLECCYNLSPMPIVIHTLGKLCYFYISRCLLLMWFLWWMFFVCLFSYCLSCGLIYDNHNHQFVTCLNKQTRLECNQVSWDDLDLPLLYYNWLGYTCPNVFLVNR